MASVFDISWLSYVYSQSVVPLYFGVCLMPDCSDREMTIMYHPHSCFVLGALTFTRAI